MKIYQKTVDGVAVVEGPRVRGTSTVLEVMVVGTTNELELSIEWAGCEADLAAALAATQPNDAWRQIRVRRPRDEGPSR